MIGQRYPIFRVFLLFCSGILLANFVNISFLFFSGLMLFSLFATVFFAFLTPVFHSYRRRWLFGLSVSFLFFFLGVFITHLHREVHFKNFANNLPEGKSYYELELLEDPREKHRSFGMMARLIRYGDLSKVVHGSMKVMLYLQKSEAAEHLHYGDRIVIQTSIQELKGPQNPFEFDYRNFLNLKAIYAQAYADSSSWKYLSSGHGWRVISFAKQARRYFLTVVDAWNLPAQEEAITKALLLGYRYDIDDTTLKAYASAGAMHVLAVSGLHVGIVYAMAGYLLFFLMKIKRGAVFKSILLILLLWLFALITGMSASVVRAATMFTFVAVGNGFRRNTSVYNTILGSAIFLLIIKPTYLFEVGFQLSYAAVLGIVWIQPKLASLYRPSTKAIKVIWDITTVSMAAQIVTFPLGLYYFHQFPGMFLVSNLIVIPIVTILMYLGLALLVISGLGWHFSFGIKLYSLLLHWMNAGVLWVEKQSVFLITEIHISRFELVLLYLAIIVGFWWILQGGYKKLVLATMAILTIGISQAIEKQHLKHKNLTVYSINGHSAIGLYSPLQSVFIADSALLKDDDALTFHVKHHWWSMDVSPHRYSINEIKEEDFDWNHKGILHLGPRLVYIQKEGDEVFPQADLVMVTEGYPNESITVSPNSKLVLSCSLKYAQLKKWEDFCVKNNLPFHNLKNSGSLVETL